ncbi:MAG: N-acetyltransferase [Clostridia bacterium]|nr:N-acetyltransferase [Clostridia bacterium]
MSFQKRISVHGRTAIYLHPATPKGCGVGTVLYQKLLDCLTAQGFRIAVGVLYAHNEGSLALHRHFGFEQTGYLRNYCYKFGQWVDAVLLEKVLNPFVNQPDELVPFAKYRKVLEDQYNDA